MNQIYTRTGDGGQTSLREGVRVDKDDLRIEVNGQIDHLNALIGLARAAHSAGGTSAEWLALLADVQRELMTIMSHIATPDGAVNPRQLHVDELTARMEQAVDDVMAARQTVGFEIPGRDMPSALMHAARTQCRTVERRLWTLNRTHAVRPAVTTFFNRLSDYLFALTL